MLLHATKYTDASASQIDNNTPLIILHGLFGSHKNWHPIARILSKKHIVYSLDCRNHGQSPHAEQMTYPDMAQDILTFIKHLKPEKTITGSDIQSVNIIAHSMGGKAAMWFALNYPERVNKLVIVDIAPVDYQHDFSDVIQAMQTMPLNAIQSRRDADRHLANTLHEKSLRDFLLQNLQHRKGQYQWRLNLDVIAQSIDIITAFPDTKTIKPFMKRVLFMGGGQSDYLSKRHQKTTKELFPRASFSMLKASGHWLHAEQPELFNAIVQPYLTSFEK